MILKQSFLAGLAILLFSIPLKSEITTTIHNNSITASTDKLGVSGYKGCDPTTAKDAPAFVFELQKKKSGKEYTCGPNNADKWTLMKKISSKENTIVFDELPEGKYRVICYSGFAIGCSLNGVTNGLPRKSIVYEKESSDLIYLSKEVSISDEIKNSLSDEISVFPNPAFSQFTVQLDNENLENEVTLSLINLLGQVVESNQHQLDNSSNQYSWIMDSSNYRPGAYFIHLTDSNGKSLQKKILIMNE